MKTLWIVNPSARGGAARRGKEVFGLAQGADVIWTEHPGHALELARIHASEYRRIVAAGGDGTVNEVASGILLSGCREVELGIVPAGTGNDIAALAGIRDLESARECLSAGQTWDWDVIRVEARENGQTVVRFAILFAAVGFSEAVLRHTTPFVKRIFGRRYSYGVGFFRALLAFHAPQMTVDIQGQVHAGRRVLLCVCNAEFAGGGTMRLAPGARLDDGLLNISLVEEMSRLEIARHFRRLRTGEHLEHPKVMQALSARVDAETEPPCRVQLDGESFGWTPARFEVMPRALRVVAVFRSCHGDRSG